MSLLLQEESLSRASIEDEKRREVSDHFQTSITSIQNQLCEYQSKNVELRKENQELAEKLGEFIKQHEKREEHVDKLGKRIQLSESEAVAWQGKWEVSQQMSESLNAKKQVEKLSGLCRALKDQLNELRKSQQSQKESQNLEAKQNEQELTSTASSTSCCCHHHPGDDDHHHLHEAEKTKEKTVDNSMKDSNLIHQNNNDNTNLNSSTTNQSGSHSINTHKTDGNVELYTATKTTIGKSSSTHNEFNCSSNSLIHCTDSMNELKLDCSIIEDIILILVIKNDSIISQFVADSSYVSEEI
uniref:Coiled-coil domain-containing protein 73 n=1 Tax=Schistosoma mansoni TaxID=6183 RepID=A0A5K4FAC8_SCHMA